MSLGGLKPNEEVMASAFAVTAVYTIFTAQVPNMADVKASPSNNSTVFKSVKGASIEATAVVSGIALLAKSPTIFTVGGMAIVALAWHYHHSNAIAPSTGKATTAVGAQ